MSANKRKPGISVLIASQNEEAVIESCLRSFLEFADEIIIVDNGSTDNTRDIASTIQSEYPDIIRFFDKPELPDLYHNRQFALQHSSHEWICRCDSDYVAYTDGEYNIMEFRDYLLSLKRLIRPEVIYVPQGNVVGDFWHTGVPMRPGGYRNNPERAYIGPGIIEPMARFYRHNRLFAFVRKGRRETVRLWYLMKVIRWPKPLWLHCNIKSDMNLFYRSERSNWRELGNFNKYPTLDSYIRSIVVEKYGTADLDAAARIYMERHILPYLQPYDENKYYPYPKLIREQMITNPVYRIYNEHGKLHREKVS